MPGVEALLARFEAAHTQVLGVSVDSVYCHAHWASSLGGISYPLLADFNPKGATASAYGLYLDDKGITDRATVIIDKDGIVRHASSVTPAGKRDIAELASLCEKVDAEHGAGLGAFEKADGLTGDSVLFVKTGCPFCGAVLAARTNLHLDDAISVKNISDGASVVGELEKLTGKSQVPCLVIDGKPMHESGDIITYLAGKATSLLG